MLDFSAIFGLAVRISGQKAEISIPGDEEPNILIILKHLAQKLSLATTHVDKCHYRSNTATRSTRIAHDRSPKAIDW
ncbi:hypothetical protein C7B77_05565 [Chamaesiphon polymorphus CCALA 037]|uniref:Uncharacterized protein n=1 Tax=Chamaesiphon polymorphus CCALA 037 TaxID=2107692 RepID=A0A2T1GK82_9CYAN|nr:hypothetical protein C7B77_05565 [Chamaesiphon polymorphus CCALA 037]